MRLIIEWLDKDDNVLFRKDDQPSSINFGDTVQVTPAIPEVKTEINLPGFPTIKGIMDDAANKYLRESITAFRIRVLEDELERSSIASAGFCKACCQSPHQYTLLDNDYKYQVCANCLPRLTNNALTPTMFFNLIRNGHTTKEHLLHGDFYDDETGEALQPR